MPFPLDLEHCTVRILCRNVNYICQFFYCSIFTLINLISNPKKETPSSLRFYPSPPCLTLTLTATPTVVRALRALSSLPPPPDMQSADPLHPDE